MQSSTTSFVPGTDPVAPLNNVRFLQFAFSYQDALAAVPLLKDRLLPGQTVVIYRVSKGKLTPDSQESVFLSRQLGLRSDGQEIHAPAIVGTQLQYELYAAPIELLSKSSPPREPKLAQAIDTARTRDLPKATPTVSAPTHGQLDPTPSGPNVVGPNPRKG
jgi:hypothetical protein